jgi:hypothetical protein
VKTISVIEPEANESSARVKKLTPVTPATGSSRVTLHDACVFKITRADDKGLRRDWITPIQSPDGSNESRTITGRAWIRASERRALKSVDGKISPSVGMYEQKEIPDLIKLEMLICVFIKPLIDSPTVVNSGLR